MANKLFSLVLNGVVIITRLLFDAIEQFSYLLFLKRLDDRENSVERQAKRKGTTYQPLVKREMRWGYWTQMEAEKALKHVKEVVFPGMIKLAEDKSSFWEYMQGAECKIRKAGLLIEACNLIDQMKIAEQNQDVQGDLYEYMLGHMQFAGRGGQFRTPRHIIRMMVQMVDPKPRERIGDLAGGTGGFLVNAHQYILEKHTSAGILEYDAEGQAHHLIGDQLSVAERSFMSSKKYLRGFDNDSGMTILRIGSMNLMLHGIESPQFYYMDSLSKSFDDEREYDVILMNPPFKGAVDKGGVHPTLPSDTTKSEFLFLHLILRALDMGGRAAVIVPDGVLFGSSRAHVEVRRRIIEENRLDGVVSMPSGVFKPYAGVSTAALFFTRGAQTKDIWFYDMAHDGFSLDDKRVAIDENDIPDVVNCWEKRANKKFLESREKRIVELRKELTPLKEKRLKLQADINRLSFELAVDSGSDGVNVPKAGVDKSSRSKEAFGTVDSAGRLAEAQGLLSTLQSLISSPQAELDRLTRQFWVTKEQVKANKYDLSASRYRQVDADAVYHEKPSVTLERLTRLESVMLDEINELKKLVKG
ncbi:MAG: N-6 DNA methylase [bacterium]|nr:N-6 DNA methylase [bacterium]